MTGQDSLQETRRVINPETIDVLIEHAQKSKKNPMNLAYETLSFPENKSSLAHKEPLFEELITRFPRAALKDFHLGEEVVYSDDEDMNPETEEEEQLPS